jgi:hypothetical protein
MPHLPWTFQKESLTSDISTEGYNNVRLTSVNIVKQKVSYSNTFSMGNLIGALFSAEILSLVAIILLVIMLIFGLSACGFFIDSAN